MKSAITVGLAAPDQKLAFIQKVLHYKITSPNNAAYQATLSRPDQLSKHLTYNKPNPLAKVATNY
jgi:hypothetical protein